MNLRIFLRKEEIGLVKRTSRDLIDVCRLSEGILNNVAIHDEYISLENDDFRIIYTLSYLDAKSPEGIAYLSKKVGFDSNRIAHNIQVHSNNVRLVDDSNICLTQEADALVTSLEEVCLMVYTADCVPIVLLDPVNMVVSAIHAGWRGTYGSIVEKALETMLTSYKTQAKDVHAYIGPFISLDNFEVGDDLYQKFEAFMVEKGVSYKDWEGAYINKDGKYHLDLGIINELLMLSLGVKRENINNLNLCTVENSDRVFSYRAHDKTEKRIGTIVEILR